MRPLLPAVMLAALLLATPVALPSAQAGPGDVDVRLTAGGEFRGSIVEHDAEGFTLKRSAGGQFRLLWKDLEPGSWVDARRSITDAGDGAALLMLAHRAADESLRPRAEDLRKAALRADGKLDIVALDRKIDTLRLTECEDLVELGKQRLKQEDWFQALGRFRDALKLQPDHAWATNGVGEAFYNLRRLREARENIERAIELDPTCKDAVFNEAYLDLLELDFQGCLDGLDRVLALPPDPGKVATQPEFAKRYKEAGEDAPPQAEAWAAWVDMVLLQAGQLRPIIQGVVGGPGWAKEYVAVTDHYRVMTDVSQEYADLMAERLELIYAEYDRQFSYSKTGERKTRGKKLVFPVLVFEKREDYVKWFTRVLKSPQLAKQTGGVYVSMVKHLVFFKGKTFDDTQLVAWHEAFHQYLDHYIARAPHWFNEGQGEYFGASVLPEGKKRVLVGQSNSWRLGALAGMLRSGRLPAAEVLIQRPANVFMGMGPKRDPRYGGKKANGPGENYAASWALVHFFIEGQRGRHEKSFLNYFRALSDGMNHANAFEKAFKNVKWERFNDAWIAHCKWLIARAIAERDGKDVPDMPR
jgi:tetratricopeptide (TPR) repeat protein